LKRRFAPLLLVLLAACRLAPEPGPAAAPPEQAWPPLAYAGLALEHAVYRLDPSGSSLDFIVRREGPLARFGHDHVITPADPEGWFLAGDPGQGTRADLRFPTRDLRIDDAASRRHYGLDTTPDEAAIAGTRENLLREVLRSETWPVVTVALDDFVSEGNGGQARLTIGWGGARYTIRRHLAIERDARQLHVTGRFSVRQTELGMTPLAILGGGLRVSDEIEVHLDLRGLRVE